MTAQTDTTRHAADADTAPPSHEAGLRFSVAERLNDVLDAWRLVYDSYRRAGLIEWNASGVHTVRQAVQPRSCVICGRIRDLTVSTLSGYVDQPGQGLPLDSVYPAELAVLRQDKRVLMEIGLFADRREHIGRSVDALLDLMRHVCHFGVSVGATDAVIGVHPRHAPFYTRLLGFDTIGPVKSYALVKHHPVVLLRLDWHAKCKLDDPPRGLRHFRENPLAEDTFANRYVLSQEAVSGSAIEEFLRGNSDHAASVA